MAVWNSCVVATRQQPVDLDLLEQFQVDDDKADELKGPDYNVAPTKLAPVVISQPPADGPRDADAVRQLRLFKWGFYRTSSLGLSHGVRELSCARLASWEFFHVVSLGRI